MVSGISIDPKDPLKLVVAMSSSSSGYTLPVATASVLGGVTVGSGLSIDGNGVLSLPIANAGDLGGVRVGNAPADSYTLSSGICRFTDGTLGLVAASDTRLGGIKVGAGLSMSTGGVLSVTASGGSSYTLPAASASTLGGVKVGSGLSIDGNGVLSVTASGGTNYWSLSGGVLSPASNGNQMITYGNPSYLTTGVRHVGNHVDGWNSGAIGNLYFNANVYNTTPSVYVRIDNAGSGVYTCSWSQVSDIRKKGNIKPLGPALEKVLLLETFHYNPLRDGMPDTAVNRTGFSANQVVKLFPEMVSEDDEGFYSLDYANMTVILVKAVQELYALMRT